ncbi:CD63 antigen-like [Mya arenaria]|uniref:CD63 antigen-like n=1 Tax=Mya arenaria TaxID=6604 RepID=UPI0022E26E4B|nr:CD63 antigen-like [Mya arenaria]
MGVLTIAGRIVLVVLNIILIIVSLLLIVFGFILKFGNEIVRPYIKETLESIENAAKNVYSDSDFNTEAFDIGAMLSDLTVVMIVVGVALLAFSFVGCCSACCNISTLALVYAIVLIVLLLAQVILVILVYAAPGLLKDNLNKGLDKTFDKYEGLKSKTTTSVGWNWAMQYYDCCGGRSYKDFENKGTWKVNDATGQSFVLLTPVACCKALPGDGAGIDDCAGDTDNAAFDTIAEISANSNAEKGCTEAIFKKVITDNNVGFLTVIGIFFACQIALIIFAMLIFKDRGITGGLV